MRGLAVALTLFSLTVSGAARSAGTSGRIAFLQGDRLVVLDLGTGKQTTLMTHAPPGPVRWSGNGKLVSDAGRIAGGPTLPATQLVWAPSGESAAYETKARSGAVLLWSHRRTRTIVPAGWGATSFAWGPNGALALGRSACNVPCGAPKHQGVWVWREGTLHRVVGPLHGIQLPLIAGWTSDGRVLWWSDPQGSGSLAADGLVLYANRAKIATTLVYPDYIVRCGRHLALAAGGDRFATHGKRILFDGRDVSHDATRSWVSPSCTARGTKLVAAAGKNWEEPMMGRGELRAIWQLLPTRSQLTDPAAGWTDESPHVLADGSVLFVRTKQTSRKVNGHWLTTSRGLLELLADGKVTRLAQVGFTASDTSGVYLNDYGHYDWSSRIAVTP